MNISLSHLKSKCAACECPGRKMNKEHVFPRWLILRTNTHNTGIRWGDNKRLPALRATLPLCIECNAIFGRELEGPVSRLFDEIESFRGISDSDAELLIRWLWKLEGLVWVASHPDDKYTINYTLRERVLRPIDDIRRHLVLAVSLIEELHPESEDWPMGIDSDTEHDAIFVSGVFSKIAMMVTLEAFIPLLPEEFSCYRLAPKKDAASDAKFFHPKIGFKNDVDAIVVTYNASGPMAKVHDEFAKEIEKATTGKRKI
jgi:hypothetical protein